MTSRAFQCVEQGVMIERQGQIRMYSVIVMIIVMILPCYLPRQGSCQA